MTDAEFREKVLTEFGEVKVLIARLQEQMKAVQASRKEVRGTFLSALVAVVALLLDLALRR